MHRIIAGGTGFIGQALVAHWLAQDKKIAVIGRDKNKIKKIFNNTVTAISWEDSDLIDINNTEVIVNLTGENIASGRWTERRKQAILQSRIESTQQLAKLCAQLAEKSPPLFNASAIGVYGLQSQEKQDEDTQIDFTQYPDFSSEIARQWEVATEPAVQAGVRVINMRFGVVLGEKGGALSQIVLPFRFGLGGKIGTGKQFFSWVALPDLLKAIDFLLEHKNIIGPVNLVAPSCITQYELAKAIGKTLHRPTMIPMPAWAMKLLFGKMAEELLLQGQYIYPTCLLNNGFKFDYSDIQSALHYCLT